MECRGSEGRREGKWKESEWRRENKGREKKEKEDLDRKKVENVDNDGEGKENGRIGWKLLEWQEWQQEEH